MSCVTQWRQKVSAGSMLPPSKRRLIGNRSRKRGKRRLLQQNRHIATKRGAATFCSLLGAQRTSAGCWYREPSSALLEAGLLIRIIYKLVPYKKLADSESEKKGTVMVKLLKGLAKDESGATAIEYGLIAAGISVAIIAVVQGLGTKLKSTFTAVQGALN